MHPSESLRGTKGHELDGKRIVLGMTGSIAAVESFELVRELIRHGAEVHVVMSGEAAKLVTPYAMEFASGNPVITELTGKVEHVSLLGDYPGKADLLLVAPCTANTISKMAVGIDDTPVTTMATIAIGSQVPVMVAPAMHLSMYQHPAVQRNVATLTDMGVELIGPHVEGKKARVATVQEITDRVLIRFGRGDLRGKRVLIIGGSTEEPIDEVRVVTNASTGETAVQLALAARMRGAEVELWTGRMLVPVPPSFPRREFRRVEDLLEMVGNIDHDVVVVPAALSDYAPVPTKGKVSSDKKELTVKMKLLPKVLPTIRERAKVLVGFKAEVDVPEDDLIVRSRARIKEYGLDLVVANDLRDVAVGRTRAVLVTGSKASRFEGTKRELADRVFDEALKGL